MRNKKKFNVLDYVDYAISTIFIMVIVVFVSTIIGIIVGIPWLIGIIEQLLDKV